MEQYQLFLESHPIKSFKKGATIFLQHTVPETAYIIKRGVVATYDISGDGDEQPLTFDTQSEVLPIGWVFGKINRTLYFYRAFTDCLLYSVPRESFTTYLKTHPDIAYEMYAGLAARVASMQARIHGLQQPKASSKLLFTLKMLVDRFGAPQSTRMIRLRLPLTQQELASFVGLTRETVSIEFKKFTENGILTRQGTIYYVDVEKLCATLEDA